jgi:hypothetical protein
MYLLCNSRIHVITLYLSHVCVYYASMLRCWHLIWILVRTDHPCLGVGCHNSPPFTVFWGEVIETQSSNWPQRWDQPNILPIDLNLIFNFQFNTKLITHFIIDQYIEKLHHNSRLHATRLNNYYAHLYSEIDSYFILDL